MLDLSRFRLTFEDEFSTSRVSATGAGTVWADTRASSILRPDTDFGFGQSAFVDPSTGIEPFTVSPGAVQITAAPATGAAAALVAPGLYTSGLLQSSHSFSQTFGYVEMRAELPAEPGTWPGFWLLASNGHGPPGGPTFTVWVDGHEVGRVHEVAADHASGARQDVSVTGDFAPAAHTVAVVNDGHGAATFDPATGWQMNDRNLYVSGVVLNGHAYAVAPMVANTASGGCDWLDPHAAVMVANGTASFLLN